MTMRRYVDMIADTTSQAPNFLLSLCENVSAAPVITLYRGDGSVIDEFKSALTDLYALFGHGIYLTDTKRVANDYVSKGASDSKDIIFQANGRKTKADVLNAWLRREARMIDLDGKANFYGQSVPFSNGADFGNVSTPLAQHEYAIRMDHARAKWKTLSRDYEIRMKLDGSAVIQKKLKQKADNLSIFKIPTDYVGRCFHADEEISPRVVACLVRVLETFRDQQTAVEMKSWIKHQEYENTTPTFRDCYRSFEAECPLVCDREAQVAFQEQMLALGYVGIEYNGGVTLGGGHKHRAFVFWNQDEINAFRQKTG